jgi:hypothetical protein
LLLCSDGLSGLVHTDTLRTALAEVKDPSDCCLKLIELAEAGGGHDNITCIVADFDGDQLTSPAEGDGFGYMQYPLPLSDDDSSAFVEDETAGGPRRESTEDVSSAPTQRPMAVASDHDGELDGDDSRANALWILAGAVALIGALGVWWTLDPKAQGSSEPQVVTAPPAPVPPPVPAVEEVQVNVYTDVASATLLVNGDSQGALSAEQSKSLKLKPGAYRFEAQADGQPKAVTVVTVRGDMPMDVFLKTPAAEAEEPKPEGKAAEPKAGEPKAAEPKEPKPAEDKPRTSAPEEPEEAVAAQGEEPAPRKPRKRPATAEPAPSAEPATPATPELPSNPF